MSNPSFKNYLKEALLSLLDLIYPPLCILCGARTFSVDNVFCSHCQSKLHPHDMYLYPENAFTAKFKGRLPIIRGAALYDYIKGGSVQDAIERLKYRNEPQIGIEFGKYFGRILENQPAFCSAQLILPVPLHRHKRAKRGYNQAALIASGLSDSLNIPWREDLLIRTKHTNSQVQKNRMERMRNMRDAFQVKKPEILSQKHILLVDDVLTTGSTLEACASELYARCPGIKISMLTIGITRN